jgi:hypothetical protein
LDYPEHIAKSYNRPPVKWRQFEECEADTTDKGLSNNEDYFETYIRENASIEPPDKLYQCSKGFIWGESSQNNFYKMLCCGKEWCADCGRKHSIPHDRRISRHLASFLGLHQAGYSIQYLVITIPKQLRKLYQDKEALADFRRYWVRKLKREGHQFGVTRYHYCGEDGYLWKPHLNILTIGSFVSRETLREWRTELSRWFKMKHQLDYDPIPNIYTSYTNDEGKIRHWLSYVMRSTQTTYNKQNEETIRNFRNVAPFKNANFEIPQYQAPEAEKSDLETATAEGYDILEDGTKEKIVWRMKYDDFKKRWRPEVVPIVQTRIDEMKLIRRGFWREKKYAPPPAPGLPPPIICPF